MRIRAALAASLACLIPLCGCAPAEPDAVLDGIAEGGPQAYVLDLELSGTSSTKGRYVTARGGMAVLSSDGGVLVRDAALRLEEDGLPFDREMEIWAEGGTAYVYIGEPGDGGIWYEYPASDTLAAGIDPLTLGRLPAVLAAMGAAGDTEAVTGGESGAFSFDIGGDDVDGLIGRTADDLVEEDVAWDGGSVAVVPDRSGRWSSISLSAVGRSESYGFEFSLDLSRLEGSADIRVPEDVKEAAKGNYAVGPVEGGGGA